MREKEKMRVIWRHPQGRFEIQETEHYSLSITVLTTRANAYLRRRTMRAGCAARCRQPFMCRRKSSRMAAGSRA